MLTKTVPETIGAIGKILILLVLISMTPLCLAQPGCIANGDVGRHPAKGTSNKFTSIPFSTDLQGVHVSIEAGELAVRDNDEIDKRQTSFMVAIFLTNNGGHSCVGSLRGNDNTALGGPHKVNPHSNCKVYDGPFAKSRLAAGLFVDVACATGS